MDMIEGHEEILGDYKMKYITEADMGDILEMLEDPDVTKFLFFAPAPPEMFKAYFLPIMKASEQAMKEKRIPLGPTVVIRDSNGLFMGMASTQETEMHKGNYELGYQLPKRAWGKGITTAVCKRLISITFHDLGAHKINADCYGSNIGSFKVMQKCGMVEEGRLEAYYKLEDGFEDKLFYGITKGQFSS